MEVCMMRCGYVQKLYIIALNGDMRPLLNVPFTCGLRIYERWSLTPRINTCLGYTFLVVFSDVDVPGFGTLTLTQHIRLIGILRWKSSSLIKVFEL
jgi:hypothetical protein